ncbi:hypothetical protein J0A67_03505 [Algoriphagus aestuariicola]|uniref:UDP-glycosyltransferase n=1 Tax=Algoriphagus aestuariicola TaxID=1852016 RepID=A0ABS3BM45_9BACT|nr:hypothetical protein [Algoriphagus aestuariicola]MBN7799909.1 hypothetical protein [Algoriphagus aestuariicola]
MKICFLIPDGVGIRNYLYSPILPLLADKGAEVVVWHGLNPEVIDQAKKLNPSVAPKEFPFQNYREDPVAQILRDSVGFARLVVNSKLTKNPTILDNWLPKKTRKGKVSNVLAKSMGKMLSNFRQIEAMEAYIDQRYRKSQAYHKYKEELKQMMPDMLFCTHQRIPHAGIAMLAARDMGIKTAVAIFSWDNLPKGRLPVRGDHFLVWSKYMKDEMALYFPDIDQRNVTIVGTPQFDFYRNRDLLEGREDFARKHNLSPSKSWICFSGDDSLTSPRDASYLRDLAERLKHREDIQILFRPVPVEGHHRYQDVLNQYPQIVLMTPKWKHGNGWNAFFPYFEDVAILMNLAKHCSTVVNVGSTMALDFSQYDKPGLYINYCIDPKHPWDIKRTYQFQHFRTMDGIDPVGWINSAEEIEPKIDLAIHHPEKVGPDRLKWRDKIVFDGDGLLASDRIVNWLVNNR